MPRTTRAIVQTGPRALELRELPIPDIGDEAALLRIEACGICGSDAEQYAGVIPVRMPLIPGHEPLGIIEQIGDRAARRWGVNVGDRVAVEASSRARTAAPVWPASISAAAAGAAACSGTATCRSRTRPGCGALTPTT
jgi:D-arabinose 1-dehydrogenase-like Zn-dependent alcohol dehydrogenase